MFIIVKDFVNSTVEDQELEYLAWQNPVWDEEGYFWTRKETVDQMIKEGANTHRFLFNKEIEARKLIRQLKLKDRCKVNVLR